MAGETEEAQARGQPPSNAPDVSTPGQPASSTVPPSNLQNAPVIEAEVSICGSSVNADSHLTGGRDPLFPW